MPAHLGFARSGVNVTLYPGEPWAFIQDPTGPVWRDAERRGSRMQLQSRRYVGVRSGALLSSIRKNVGPFRKTAVRVDLLAGGGPVKWARVHHDGSAPHEIRARRGRALRFVVGGRVMFRTRVWHPGTRGTYYLTRALPYGAR